VAADIFRDKEQLHTFPYNAYLTRHTGLLELRAERAADWVKPDDSGSSILSSVEIEDPLISERVYIDPENAY
jgi:hypothetical protein